MMKTDIHKIKTEQAWNRLYDRLDKDHLLVEDHRMPKIPMWVRYGTVAAMVVGLVFSTLYWGFGQKEELPDFITQENQDVPTLVTTLEDGSVVFLAKETSIRYPEHFVSDKREVSLQGDAFFDVAKNPDCPFRVIANGLQIEVVGTSFNVNTYKKGVVETSLLTGQIKISGGSLPQEYILTPGEKATYSSINNALKITQADVHVETGWCDDYLIFDSEPLIDVIEEIERWYGVEIELRCPQIGQDLLSGSFRHENIQNVIHSLSLQYKFKYEIHKDKITIY